MHRNIWVQVLLGLGLILTGCSSRPSKTTIVEFAQPQAVGETQNQELGSEIRVKFITASGGYGHVDAEVTRQLESFINDSQHEIVRVVTTRSNEGMLLSAEVYYQPKK